jgi:hypothetical protein
MLKALAVVTLSILAVGCSDEPSWRPKTLSFEVDYALIYGYKLEFRDEALYYYASPPNLDGWKYVQPTKITPTDAQWKDFRQALDRQRVWRWEKSYHVYLMDGWGWGLKVQYSDRQVESEGANKAPQSFEEVMRAVEQLTGKPFHVDRGSSMMDRPSMQLTMFLFHLETCCNFLFSLAIIIICLFGYARTRSWPFIALTVAFVANTIQLALHYYYFLRAYELPADLKISGTVLFFVASILEVVGLGGLAFTTWRRS